MALIRFGEFGLDEQTFELRRNGSPIRVQQQPARVLAFLLNHHKNSDPNALLCNLDLAVRNQVPANVSESSSSDSSLMFGLGAFASHTAWHSQFGQARLVRAAFVDGDDDAEVSVVGFWHVKFVSDGVSSGIPGGVPVGTEVDAGYSQWHADGTEIMNSGGRAPNTGNFCLGVWEKTGVRQYNLNHFGTAWDPTKGTVGPAGP